jgi:hypothetical protein
MSQPVLSFPHITEAAALEALTLAHGDGHPQLQALNPADLAKYASFVAKYAPMILAAMSAAGFPIPQKATQIVTAIVAFLKAMDPVNPIATY